MNEAESSRPTILLASGNVGKIRELQQLVGDLARVVSAAEKHIELPEETGSTFSENAILKSEAGAHQSGLLTIADDSGLVVPAINGDPGVHSARYSGEPTDDARNRAKLFAEMNNIQAADRVAYFVSVIAISRPNGGTKTVEGRVSGSIAFEERGTNGFGYDSMFLMPDGRMMAELTDDEKNAVSHRGNAMRLALPIILEEIEKVGLP